LTASVLAQSLDLFALLAVRALAPAGVDLVLAHQLAQHLRIDPRISRDMHCRLVRVRVTATNAVCPTVQYSAQTVVTRAHALASARSSSSVPGVLPVTTTC
jgi:hypothetical protein